MDSTSPGTASTTVFAKLREYIGSIPYGFSIFYSQTPFKLIRDWCRTSRQNHIATYAHLALTPAALSQFIGKLIYNASPAHFQVLSDQVKEKDRFLQPIVLSEKNTPLDLANFHMRFHRAPLQHAAVHRPCSHKIKGNRYPPLDHKHPFL